MSEFITLTCPSCGGKLEITKDIERFACAHCGREHVVRRAGSTISVAPVVDAIGRVGSGVDRTASELALARIQQEIHGLRRKESDLIGGTPRPQVSPLAFFMIPLGLLLAVVAVLTVQDNGFTPVVFSILMVGLGALLVHNASNGTHRWDRDFLPRIAAIDAEIAEKEGELRRHHNIIAGQ
jgi:predicted RNA-binding Zn-ribbon protein involved in translation (DUF1610 family)